MMIMMIMMIMRKPVTWKTCYRFLASHCIALHRIASHCIALHRIASHCIASHCIALHCIASFLREPGRQRGKVGWTNSVHAATKRRACLHSRLGNCGTSTTIHGTHGPDRRSRGLGHRESPWHKPKSRPSAAVRAARPNSIAGRRRYVRRDTTVVPVVKSHWAATTIGDAT
jgi:hypothetical protein